MITIVRRAKGKPKSSWIDKYRNDPYDPVVIRLSNGTSLRIYVGNGFDGGSGFQFEGPQHGTPPVIPAKDYALVRRALLWYAQEEMRLRFSEGVGTTKYFDCLSRLPLKQADPTFQSESSPYQAMYMAGQLTPTKPNCHHSYGRNQSAWFQLPSKLSVDVCSLCLVTRKHKKGTKERIDPDYTILAEKCSRGIK